MNEKLQVCIAVLSLYRQCPQCAMSQSDELCGSENALIAAAAAKLKDFIQDIGDSREPDCSRPDCVMMPMAVFEELTKKAR